MAVHKAALAAAFATMVAFAGCSSGDEGAQNPCLTDLADECGTACAEDFDCPNGLYCSGGECTADCVPGGGQCKSGTGCNGFGRCVAGLGNDLFDNGDGFGSGDGDECIRVDVGFERLTPTVIILIDRSGSMNEPFDQGLDRWESVRRTLIDANGVIQQLEDQVRFGLALYTSVDGFNGGECPMLTTVDVSIGNYDEIAAVYGSAEIGNDDDDTPTSESLRAVTQMLLDIDLVGPKAIVLATDGEPDTCDDADAHNAASNQLSVDAVNDAFAEGITTHVISVGDDVGADHLQDLANAGVGVNDGAEYYQALSAQNLVDAFDGIIRGVVSCDFTLNGDVQDGKESLGRVEIDGVRVPYDDPNGWELTSPSSIRLLGDACNSIRSSGTNLSIGFPCGAFVLK